MKLALFKAQIKMQADKRKMKLTSMSKLSEIKES